MLFRFQSPPAKRLPDLGEHPFSADARPRTDLLIKTTTYHIDFPPLPVICWTLLLYNATLLFSVSTEIGPRAVYLAERFAVSNIEHGRKSFRRTPRHCTLQTMPGNMLLSEEQLELNYYNWISLPRFSTKAWYHFVASSDESARIKLLIDSPSAFNKRIIRIVLAGVSFSTNAILLTSDSCK